MAPDPARCPRCGAELLPPTLMHEEFRCTSHGSVAPLQSPVLPDSEALQQLAQASDVPIWVPWPLPDTWVFTGLRFVGGGKRPAAAAAIGLTGHALFSGPADLIIVSEKPGTGLGAYLAGIEDPGEGFITQAAATKVRASGWLTPLWSLEQAVAADDRAIYVGEAAGNWLWLIAWPNATWSVIHDSLNLVDLRETIPFPDLPAGAMMPRLRS